MIGQCSVCSLSKKIFGAAGTCHKVLYIRPNKRLLNCLSGYLSVEPPLPSVFIMHSDRHPGIKQVDFNSGDLSPFVCVCCDVGIWWAYVFECNYMHVFCVYLCMSERIRWKSHIGKCDGLLQRVSHTKQPFFLLTLKTVCFFFCFFACVFGCFVLLY